MRKVSKKYNDPLDLVWLHAAAQMGMEVRRDASVFASWDGCGVLTIGAPETLDPDDCLAQMILHETCHALVEGPDAWFRPDWGIDITDPGQRIREYACLRLQAALTAPFGLRDFLASTTVYRRYYDLLPEDPLAIDESSAPDPAVSMAREGMIRAKGGVFSQPLQMALQRTATIAAVVIEVAPSESLWETVRMSGSVS